MDHGRATYLHDPREGVSYFVKLEDSRGERTIWGVDLERALRESLTRPQPGDEVGLRAVRQDPVTVKAQERDPDRVVGTKDLATHRNRWIVEKREFFEELGIVPQGECQPLGEVKQKSGKIVTAFALAGDLDVAAIVPGTFEMEWPPKSGQRQSFPEVDRAVWFDVEEARLKIVPAQAAFLDRLLALAPAKP